MAEVTFRSPGVSTNEIDLSQPSAVGPVGVPAGVIGTANEGPAFVPVTVADYSTFSLIFGATDGEKFGPLAVVQFLKNAKALTYIRVLGAGDGKQRSSDSGAVTNAGFVVGDRLPQANGNVGNNVYANAGGSLGRTYFLGCFMSESLGSTVFSAANIQHSASAHPIVRGVLMTPSGVVAHLSGNWDTNSSAPASTYVAREGEAFSLGMRGSITGSVDRRTQDFTLLLNGHKGTASSPSALTASFDIEAANYFGNVLNTNPYDMESRGHYLYARYDIHSSLAVVTGTGVISSSDYAKNKTGDDRYQSIGFLTTGSLARNTGAAQVPNYESFEDRFGSPLSPYIISQDFGGTKYDLFRVAAIADGKFSNTLFKISIENLSPSKSTTNLFGTFDLVVRRFSDYDEAKVKLEEFRGLSLDPTSDRYVARVIGDQQTYFDFDQPAGSQKIVVSGDHPSKSSYIRVVLSDQLKADQIPDNALPVGYRGPNHLVTSGSNPLAGIGDASSYGFATSADVLKRAVELPVPVRESLQVGTAPNLRANSSLYWGVQFTQKKSLSKKNMVTEINQTLYSMASYFPTFQTSNRNVSVGNNPGKADAAGTVFDCDRFNNNIFTLESIKIRTGSDGVADTTEWVSASYVRNGSISTSEANKTRAFKVSDLNAQGNRKFAKFTLFLQGGFDGVNIFNEDKVRLLNVAAKREMDDSTLQGGKSGPTVSAYRKALDIMGTKADVDIKLLAIPGMRHSSISDYAIDTVESRFDAMYIMDVEERDELNTVITSSASRANVKNTVTAFNNRSLNTSFAAAYFPDTVITDPTTLTNVQVPPSVSVLGAFSLNDAIGYPWFAPAGFTRGAMGDVLFAKVGLNKANMDDLYDADINPIVAFPNTGVMVFGQKTLLATQSSLDRVNVRRLLIDIRRSVRNVANTLLFEPNRQETLDRFNALVNPILQSVQEKSGLDRYKVIIDSTTTTQADVENNTLRGKIFLQPTRTAEFVALDFVVTNAGDAFENA